MTTEAVTVWVHRHRAVLIVAAVAFAARLGWVLAVDPNEPDVWQVSGDQYGYYFHGRELAAGRGYNSYITGQPTAYYPIGYPAILAVLFWFVDHTPLTGDHLLALNVVQVVVGTVSVVLAYLIGRKLFGHLGGVVGAAILAVFPNIVFQAASVQLETMYIFWCLTALAIVVLHDWATGPPSTRRLLLFGLVLGVSVLIRPFSVWFIVALLLATAVAGAGWRRSLRVAAVPLAVVVVMSIPWTIRNAVTMDAFVVTSSNIGDTLCLDRSMDATGGFRWSDHEGCVDPDLPEVERNAANTRKAVEFVVQHPVRELEQIGRRAQLIFGSDHDGIEAVNSLGGGQRMSDGAIRTWNGLADAYYIGVLVLSAGGLVVLLARGRRRPEVILVLVSLAALVVIPLLLWGNPRFHLPFSPFLAILAGGAVGTLVERRQRPAEGGDQQADGGEQSEAMQPLEA